MKRKHIVALAVLLAVGVSARGQDSSAEGQKLVEEAAALAKADKFDEAIAAMKKAVALAPRNDLYLATLSQYEFRAKKFADGLEHARAALKLNDKVGTYYVLVAGNAAGNQDLDVAREYTDIILKREKEFGAAAANTARELKQMLAPKTYTLYWKLDPKKVRGAGATFAVALPRGRLPYQEVTYEIDGVRGQRLVKGPVNDVIYVTRRGTRRSL
jgi:tetratricopeptide (TPR) repeat protein